MLAIYLRNSPMLDNNVESFVTLTKPCKGIAEYTFLLCNSTPIRARCELRFSVDLKSKWFALGGQHWQQQQELDDLLPIIAYAGALIVENSSIHSIRCVKRIAAPPPSAPTATAITLKPNVPVVIFFWSFRPQTRNRSLLRTILSIYFIGKTSPGDRIRFCTN